MARSKLKRIRRKKSDEEKLEIQSLLAGVINTFIENMLVTIGINIILAVGLNLVVGFSGQFSLGHAGFMALGAYATGIMTQTMNTAGGFYLSILVGVVISIVVALLVGIPTLRLHGDYFAIATMGAAEIIRIVINNMKITNGAAGLFNIPQFATWDVVYIFVCLTTIVTVNFIHSRDGNGSDRRFPVRFLLADDRAIHLRDHGINQHFDLCGSWRLGQHYRHHPLGRFGRGPAKPGRFADGLLRGRFDHHHDLQARRSVW